MLHRREGRAAGDAFELRFESERRLDWEENPYAIGRIFIGEFHEPFEAPLTWWGRWDYERHWHAQARQLLSQGRALFLTSYRGPHASAHVGWPAWRQADLVIVQHHLILVARLARPFNAARPHEAVGAREAVSEDGAPVSQWTVALDAVQAFVGRGLLGDIYVPA